jgi:hypothetical protein
MRRAVLGLATCLTLAPHAYSAELYRFGRLGERLPDEDIAAITLAVADLGEPWALQGWYSQVLPEVRYVDLFVRPTVQQGRLRRGQVVHLKCVPRTDTDTPACLIWKRYGPADAYAQVAEGPAGQLETAEVRSILERPIRVHGDVADDELVSLVDYIRTSPRPRPKDGWESLGLSGSIPISDIWRNSDGSIRVLLSANGYSFQGATCTRGRDGWEINDVGYGIA